MPRREWQHPAGRFELRWDYASGGITYDEEFDEDWELVDLASDVHIAIYRGSGRKDYPDTYSGVKAVDFGADGYSIVVTHHDGKVERHGLPGVERPWWHRLLFRYPTLTVPASGHWNRF